MTKKRSTSTVDRFFALFIFFSVNGIFAFG